jgi:LDH2 family malate/lactate/ureidoglycolate dehydrogenase
MAKYALYKAQDLKDYIVHFLTHLDVPKMDARTAAEILVAADLRGVESHGLIRLNSYYSSRLRERLIDPRSPFQTISETPTTLLVDGGNGLGMVVAQKAMAHCIQKAQKSNICFASVRNSNHYGIAGYYAMMALPHGMIGISLTNSQSLVAPTYGRKAILGTNPIAVAVPAGKERPYVLDMATSIVPIGRITVYEKSRKPIPEGWGIDLKGQVTVDPSAVLEGGALMPLGGVDFLRGYKGYGLAMLVDIFSGILSGAACGTDVANPSENRAGANVGHFFAAIKVEAFRPLIDFEAQMDHLIKMLKESPKAEGLERIYIAGEKEFELAERYEKEGVPVMDEVVKMLSQGGQEVGVPWDLEPIGEKFEQTYLR